MNEFSITSFNLRNGDASFHESPHVLSSHDAHGRQIHQLQSSPLSCAYGHAQDLYGPCASHAVGIDD